MYPGTQDGTLRACLLPAKVEDVVERLTEVMSAPRGCMLATYIFVNFAAEVMMAAARCEIQKVSEMHRCDSRVAGGRAS